MKWYFYHLVMNNNWHVDFCVDVEEVAGPNQQEGTTSRSQTSGRC
jgi:hypothetical protein